MKLQPWARAAFWLATVAVLVLTLLPAEHLPARGPFNFWDKFKSWPVLPAHIFRNI